jgi:general secretion pathway protein C
MLAAQTALPSAERALRLIALIVLLVAGAAVVEQLLTGPDLPRTETLQLPEPAVATAGALPPPDWRLFGTPQAIDYGLGRPVEPTPLALRLRGAVTGERGYAIIVDADGNEGVYRVGDELPGDARVVEIEARRVLLRRAGRTEALALPAGADAGRSTVRAPTAPSGSETGSDTGDPTRGFGIGSLSSVTGAFALDPDDLARRITILPVAGGGFRVRAGRDATLFTRLGFHVNDVVTAINGQPVSTQADVRAVFENYNPGERIAITVRRGDRQLVLTPDLTDF